MHKVLFVVTLSLILSGCMTYTVGEKGFFTEEGALAYQNEIISKEIDKVKPAEHFGGSLLIPIPSDYSFSSSPYFTGNCYPCMSWNAGLEEFFLTGYYRQYFEGIRRAIEKSQMFDTVDILQKVYKGYAKDHGYRYFLDVNGDGSLELFDLFMGKDKLLRSPPAKSLREGEMLASKGYDDLVNIIESAVKKFENSQSTKNLKRGYNPVVEKLVYNDETRLGKLSIKGRGIRARSWMIAKIGEIISSKNTLLKHGEKPRAGYFKVLDEKIENNIFTIEFEATY